MSWQAFCHVINLTLPATEKWLLVCLSNHADVWGDSIFPSLDTLAAETGMSRSTVRRAFRELLDRDVLEQVAEATPVSPAFYRIVGVPEPKEPVKEPQCQPALRRAVIHAFGYCCEYCHRAGTRELGPDDKPWNVDRVIPGKRGGIYTPDNVTLACRGCNAKKKANPAPDGVRTLADRLRERRSQFETPSKFVGGLTEDPPTVQPETREVPQGTPGGVNLTPEPVNESVLEPVTEQVQAGAGPRRTPKAHEETTDNVGVITKLAHIVILELGPTHVDLTEAVKAACAQHHIAYDSGVVRAAIESAIWQRRHAVNA